MVAESVIDTSASAPAAKVSDRIPIDTILFIVSLAPVGKAVSKSAAL
jgi:hypothetical protein